METADSIQAKTQEIPYGIILSEYKMISIGTAKGRTSKFTLISVTDCEGMVRGS